MDSGGDSARMTVSDFLSFSPSHPRMLVETHDLTKRYGRVTALDRCTLSHRRRRNLRPAGTQRLRQDHAVAALLGYLRPTAGAATIDRLDCYRDSVAGSRARGLFAGRGEALPPDARRDVLRFFAEVRPDGDLDRRLALADRLALDLSRSVSLMSTGMRQKTALAAVLSTSAPLLILDEPTTNLDPTARSEVLAIVREAQAAGRTVLFSSHVLGEVEETCDRVVILRRGQVVHEQAMQDLRRQHRIRGRLTGALPRRRVTSTASCTDVAARETTKC